MIIPPLGKEMDGAATSRSRLLVIGRLRIPLQLPEAPAKAQPFLVRPTKLKPRKIMARPRAKHVTPRLARPRRAHQSRVAHTRSPTEVAAKMPRPPPTKARTWRTLTTPRPRTYEPTATRMAPTPEGPLARLLLLTRVTPSRKPASRGRRSLTCARDGVGVARVLPAPVVAGPIALARILMGPLARIERPIMALVAPRSGELPRVTSSRLNGKRPALAARPLEVRPRRRLASQAVRPRKSRRRAHQLA